MEAEIFEAFQKLIYRESGIVLTEQKVPLLSSRIQKRLKALGIDSESEYLRILELDVSGNELVALLDVVSTNVTYFYREAAHFELYRTILADLAKRGRDEVKIWCAAASSGEEPYTLAFEGLEALSGTRTKLKILATDISLTVLRRAACAVYSDTVVSKIRQDIRHKYLTRIDDLNWRVNRDVVERILFKRLNLVEQPYKLRGPFDIIFCRNVMIYFDNSTRESIVQQFEKLLGTGGYLFVSHSENLLNVDHKLDKVNASVFRRCK